MDGILPSDIMENILSRLPVKSLLRFKSVSKSWKTTISDPRFAKTHREQSKNSYSRYLFMWYPDNNIKLRESHVNVVKFENQEFRIVSTIEYPWKTYFGVLCHCDGLLLTEFRNGKDRAYVLWNPSSRSYTRFHCPHSIDAYYKTTFGLCYDPLIMDYKVIVTDMKHYAIYYCRNNCWTEMKELPLSGGEVLETRGFSFDGDFYWFVTCTRPGEERGLLFEMICFDSKAEKFKKVPMHESIIDPFDLKDLGGNFCMIPSTNAGPRNQVSLMKKVSSQDSLTKFSVPLQFLGSWAVPMCLVNEDEVILDVIDEFVRVYKLSTRTFADVPIPPRAGEKFSWSVRLPCFFPYQDNMFSAV